MLKIEDSLFDLDMLLSTTRKTASSLGKLMKENNVGDVRKQMNGMMLRCITLLYANADEKVVRQLYGKPEEGIPILLVQLRRKEMELLEQKRNFKITR